MELELPSMPASIRGTYQSRLQSSKQGLDRVKKTLVSRSPFTSYAKDVSQKDIRQEAQRAELLGGDRGGDPGQSDDPYSDDFDQRSRLLAGTQRLEDGKVAFALEVLLRFYRNKATG
jgi:vesicle transport through interaction with t-SNAREs protein 1